MREDFARGDALGLNEDELAFYDAYAPTAGINQLTRSAM